MARLRLLLSLPRRLWTYATLRPLTWLEDEGVAACGYPRDRKSLQRLAAHGVTVVINLHQRPHPDERLSHYGLTETHLPVPDFTPPTPFQLEQGVTAISTAIASGQKVAVHCGAGLGRTGTLLACYLVSRGLGPDAAIARIRAARPGSIETSAQAAAVFAYARHLHDSRP